MSTPRLINGLDELRSLVGEHLGYSDWLEITQDRIDTFADATGDHQWIHVDVERAKAGPVRRPDRPRLPHAVPPPDAALTDRAASRASRWASTTASTSSASRAGARRLEAAPRRQAARGRPRSPAACRPTMELTFEVEGATKPSCVAEALFRCTRAPHLAPRLAQRNSGITFWPAGAASRCRGSRRARHEAAAAELA